MDPQMAMGQPPAMAAPPMAAAAPPMAQGAPSAGGPDIGSLLAMASLMKKGKPSHKGHKVKARGKK